MEKRVLNQTKDKQQSFKNSQHITNKTTNVFESNDLVKVLYMIYEELHQLNESSEKINKLEEKIKKLQIKQLIESSKNNN